MRTKVAIIGAGPAGALLSLILSRAGIDNVALERRSRDYVLNRIRAGVLEWGSVEVLRSAGAGERLDRDGTIHDGSWITWGGGNYLLIDTKKHTGRQMMAYGQTRIQEDLYAACDAIAAPPVFEAADVQPHDVTSDSPSVTYAVDGKETRLECDYVVGCDGFHGVSRTAIPPDVQRTFDKEYPFGWLGILSETPPLPDLIYCNHANGFALASQRGPAMSRYYIQCSLNDTLDDWPDERFWQELKTRFPPPTSEAITTGPSIEKSIAPIRSFVAEPMRYGNLFLAGDAAHIVPPTGAKGLNLAISDVYYLSRGLIEHYAEGDDHGLDRYSEVALRRVWGAVRFSWWLTKLLHRFPDQTPFDHRAQEVEFDYIATSPSAQQSMCEQYAGLPFE